MEINNRLGNHLRRHWDKYFAAGGLLLSCYFFDESRYYANLVAEKMKAGYDFVQFLGETNPFASKVGKGILDMIYGPISKSDSQALVGLTALLIALGVPLIYQWSRVRSLEQQIKVV